MPSEVGERGAPLPVIPRKPHILKFALVRGRNGDEVILFHRLHGQLFSFDEVDEPITNTLRSLQLRERVWES